MYEDLIKQLRDVSIYFGQFDYVSVLLLEAADAIEVLSKMEKATQWISVTERLPKEGEFVLVYGNLYPNKHDGGVIAVSKRMDWNYWQGFGRERNITHWMPLPETPKEESNGV